MHKEMIELGYSAAKGCNVADCVSPNQLIRHTDRYKSLHISNGPVQVEAMDYLKMRAKDQGTIRNEIDAAIDQFFAALTNSLRLITTICLWMLMARLLPIIRQIMNMLSFLILIVHGFEL